MIGWFETEKTRTEYFWTEQVRLTEEGLLSY